MKDKRFAYNTDYGMISNVSTDGDVTLSSLIGDTLARMMRTLENPLELIRLHFEGYTLVARRRFNDIKVEFYERK